jgi:NAD+ synthase (glutamine-hydrolysing)
LPVTALRPKLAGRPSREYRMALTSEPRHHRPANLSDTPFDSIYRHGFVRVAVATPRVEVASPALNAAETIDLAKQAASERAALALFPELGLSAYSNEDLFQQDALLEASNAALAAVLEASRELAITLVVGLPLLVDGRLFNCGVALRRGRLLGAVPKTYLPNYREFYEKRQFASSLQAVSTSISLLGQSIPFGTDLLFEATNVPG